MSDARTKVLIVDDSAVVRSLLSRILGADPALEVVGTAADAFSARDRIKQLQPHVLTLDVEMPGMDGLQFLKNLMRLHPMPVVMCSSLTQRGAEVTLAALELGAIDFIAKPNVDELVHGLEAYGAQLVAKVKVAATARVRAAAGGSMGTPAPSLPHSAAPVCNMQGGGIIAVGASTGGTEAIRKLLSGLPSYAPGVLVALHIPRTFSAQFAARLNARCALTVCEAGDGQRIERGHAYIAPGDRHLRVESDGTHYRCRLDSSLPVNRHRPSVDVLFGSVAAQAGSKGIGVLLTGMGDDGARGLKQMHDRGAATFAQDEESSVVWGMPRAAVALGAAQQTLPIDALAAALMQSLRAQDGQEGAAERRHRAES